MLAGSMPFIVGIVMFLVIMVIIVAGFYLGFRTRKLRSDEIIAAIEKGVDVPFPPPRKINHRNLGMISTGLGIALFIALWVSVNLEGAVWGLLPVGLGVALLLIARSKHSETTQQVSESLES